MEAVNADIKAQLLRTCRELFLKFGYGKVTVDEIAREMGMSKKTIYVYFPGKKKILQEVLDGIKDELMKGVDSIWADGTSDFQAKFRLCLIFVGTRLAVFTPYNLVDMQKHTPDLLDYVKQIKKDLVYQALYRYLEEGKRQKIFREDVPTEVLILFYSAVIHNMLDESGILSELPKHIREAIPSTKEQVFTAIADIIYSGILRG